MAKKQLSIKIFLDAKNKNILLLKGNPRINEHELLKPFANMQQYNMSVCVQVRQKPGWGGGKKSLKARPFLRQHQNFLRNYWKR